jgi:xylulokinase
VPGAGPGGAAAAPAPDPAAATGSLADSSPAQIATGYGALTRAAALAPPGAEGLFFLPHLMGERGPQPNPLARGALVGLTLRHRREHVARAVLEGTVFQIRRVVEAAAQRSGATPRAGIVCGGATRSPLWMQVLADVSGLALRAPAVVECGALGAALLGGVAAGQLTLEQGQRQLARPGQRYGPEPAAAARYASLYARYCELDDLLMPWFERHAAHTAHAEAVERAGPAGQPAGGQDDADHAGHADEAKEHDA